MQHEGEVQLCSDSWHVEGLLVWAIEDGLFRMAELFDADRQDALVKFAARFTAAAPEGCAECGKTSTPDCLWAFYCVECIETKVGPALAAPRPPLTLTGHQLLQALEFVSPQRDADQLDSEVSITWREAGVDTEGEAFEAGLCCWLTEYPEEGCMPLDGKAAEG